MICKSISYENVQDSFLPWGKVPQEFQRTQIIRFSSDNHLCTSLVWGALTYIFLCSSDCKILGGDLKVSNACGYTSTDYNQVLTDDL